MFSLDHVAIQTHDIPGMVKYYVENFDAQVLYEDPTWAFLRLGQGKIALVSPKQHPPHVAMRVSLAQLESAAMKAGKPIDSHRDGTQGIYLNDPAGNVVELIYYPPGHTFYDAGKEAV